MVGLSLGRRPIIVASLLTCGLIFLMAHPIHGLSYLLLYAIPLIILTDRALLNRKVKGKETQWYPVTQLILWLLGLTAAIVIIAVLMISPYNDPTQLKESIQQLAPLLGPQPEGAIEALGQVLPYFPAFFGFSWCFSMLINGALAQGILVGLKANLRPSPLLSDIHLPRWFLGVTAIAFILTLMNLGIPTQLGANLLPICMIPFSLVGLGFAHKHIATTPAPQVMLILFYGILIFFLWPLIFLAIAGMILTFLRKA